MRAELISIGSEITSGQNLDTNTQWLSQRLAEVGILVGWHTTIADDLAINREAFEIASRRSALVLSTGGLGPTQDDLTRQVLAEVAGVELIHSPEQEEAIREMFRVRGREMTARNRVQAFFPQGSEPLPNPNGTAPGVWMRIGEAWVGAMPGVPHEMKLMFQDQLLPRVRKLGLAQGVQIQRKINCFGQGEAQVEEQVHDLTRRDHVPEVGITASNATISMRILARGATAEEARQQIEPIERTIRERLGKLVFGVDEEELQHAVLALLAEKRKTLAVAEGVTGGHIGQMLTSVPGSSASFYGGVLAYDNSLCTSLLEVPPSLIEKHGAVSAEVAEAMAIGCRKLLGTDLAVSTVGIAGPGGATATKPVGLVYAGLAWEGGVTSYCHNWLAGRTEIQSRTAKLALNAVRLHLLKERT